MPGAEGDGRPGLTRAQAREIDRIAVEEFGMSSLVLMENAGLLAALRCRALRANSGPVWILCGAGNNGGDGLVVARQLALRGIGVQVVLAKEPGPGDCAAQLAIARRAGQEVRILGESGQATVGRPLFASGAEAGQPPALFVDALLGTGFQGQVRDDTAGLLESARQALALHPCPVVALDLPSGMDCDTGGTAPGTLKADWTLTFAARKRAFEVPGAQAWTGHVEVLPIGCPAEVLERVRG